MKIRKLEREEHGRTRRLYETVFPEDEPCFVDYYYQCTARENTVYAAEDGTEDKHAEIRAMLHLNPCRISWDGKAETIPYIVAVATQKEYRHHGLMRQLLTASLQDLYAQRIPFAFLMPAAEAIYTPFGFRRAWGWRWEEEAVLSGEKKNSGREPEKEKCREAFGILRAASIEENTAAPAEQCSEQQLLELSSRVNAVLSSKFHLFSLRSLEYYRKLDREQQASGGKLEILFARENGRKVPVSARCTAKEKFPPMMARIIHLESFLCHIRSREQKTFYLQITDKLLPENSGFCKIKLTPAGGELVPINSDETERFNQEIKTVDITEIPELLGEDNPFASAMICEVV